MISFTYRKGGLINNGIVINKTRQSLVIASIVAATFMAAACNQGDSLRPAFSGRIIRRNHRRPSGGIYHRLSQLALGFFINVPIGVMACLLAIRVLPSEHNSKEVEHKEPFDVFGSIFIFFGLFLLLYALNVGRENGWTSDRISPRKIAGVSILLAAATSFIFVFTLGLPGLVYVGIYLFLLGIAYGFYLAPMNNLAMSWAPEAFSSSTRVITSCAELPAAV